MILCSFIVVIILSLQLNRRFPAGLFDMSKSLVSVKKTRDREKIAITESEFNLY